MNRYYSVGGFIGRNPVDIRCDIFRLTADNQHFGAKEGLLLHLIQEMADEIRQLKDEVKQLREVYARG